MNPESGGQELLYKPLDTIYSLRSRYLSVVYIEKRFSITSSISCLGVQGRKVGLVSIM